MRAFGIRWLMVLFAAAGASTLALAAVPDDDLAFREREWADLSGRQAQAVALSMAELQKLINPARVGEFWVGVRSKPGDSLVVVSWNQNDRRQRDGGFVFEVNVDTRAVKRRSP